jgi:hypothetical protein
MMTDERAPVENADEPAASQDLKPYLRYVMAAMQCANVSSHVQKIAQLPLEKRYVWRVAFALKWAFADFDDLPVLADRDTLAPEDRQKVMMSLNDRPIQFCLFLKALLGQDVTEQMMAKAVKIAKQNE